MLGTWGCVGAETSLSADDLPDPAPGTAADSKPVEAKQQGLWPNRSHKNGAPQASGPRVDAVVLNLDETGVGSGFRFKFTADAHSRVAWNEDAGYSMFDARWKISTVTAQVSGLAP